MTKGRYSSIPPIVIEGGFGIDPPKKQPEPVWIEKTKEVSDWLDQTKIKDTP